jgi:NAD(P)-dependent dehydrogenase (short-subunit alcohol dehydrogenase family)
MRRGQLEGKVVVVTAAAAGIGKATALRLAQERPAALVCIDIAPEVNSTAEQIAAQGTVALALNVDCKSRGEIEAGFRKIATVYGDVDVLINAVGGSARERVSHFYQSDPDTWRHVIDLSLLSAMLCCRQVVPAMRARRFGRIVNVSSTAWLSPQPNFVDYAAAKAGIVGFTRGLALELAPFRVTVNAVSPGPIRTHALETLPEDMMAQVKAKIPMGDIGAPEDVAGPIAFLVGPESTYITGQNLAINGGRAMI